MGRVFHATCADPKGDYLTELTTEEAKTVCQWRKPVDAPLDNGIVLKYEDAEKEIEVCLDEYGDYTDDPEKALVIGHLDMAWVLDGTAYIGDIKKSEWTTEGPETLQLHSYGMAYAQKHDCDNYVLGIWAAIEGRWTWSNQLFDLTLGAASTWAKIARAASNEGEAVTGPHCRSCYARLHCPEHCLPAALASTDLAPVAEGGELTNGGYHKTSQMCSKRVRETYRWDFRRQW
jgi:hypothetical protein